MAALFALLERDLSLLVKLPIKLRPDADIFSRNAVFSLS